MLRLLRAGELLNLDCKMYSLLNGYVFELHPVRASMDELQVVLSADTLTGVELVALYLGHIV